ncbi:MAG: hypothetical protein ACK4E7_12795 [Permianibacter sp.]
MVRLGGVGAVLLALAMSCSVPAEVATASATSGSCPASIGNRGVLLASLRTLGNRLTMGRLCAVPEVVLVQLKQQTLNGYAGCLLTYQIKATEIQDALETARPLAHAAWKQAKDKQQLCEAVQLATN